LEEYKLFDHRGLPRKLSDLRGPLVAKAYVVPEGHQGLIDFMEPVTTARSPLLAEAQALAGRLLTQSHIGLGCAAAAERTEVEEDEAPMTHCGCCSSQLDVDDSTEAAVCLDCRLRVCTDCYTPSRGPLGDDLGYGLCSQCVGLAHADSDVEDAEIDLSDMED